MRRSNVRGQATFGQLMSELSLYADWALDAGVEMSIDGLLRHDLIERWIAERGDGQSPTWGNRRSRLRNLASHVNPGPSAPRRGTPFSRAAVKAPYTLRELADLERLALNQPSAASRRNLCTMLALGAGAGLSSSDLRGVTRAHLTQDAEGHWWVDVPGERSRRVPVRTSYVRLLEAAVDGLQPTDLLLGTKPDRKNITGSAVANSTIGATNPMPEQARLRASWLLAVITAPVPIADVMAASGTASARSIVELLPYSTNPAYVARDQEVRHVHPQ